MIENVVTMQITAHLEKNELLATFSQGSDGKIQ